MNTRRVMMGAGLTALAGFSALAAPGFFTRNGNEGKVTLRSRILEYEDALQQRKPFPSTESIKVDITALMRDYFKIGMSYEECLKVLEENDLKADVKSVRSPDGRYDTPVFFDTSIVSHVNLSNWMPLISFKYRLFLGFKKNILDDFGGGRFGTGP